MTAAPPWDFITLHGRMLALYRLAAQDGPRARAQIEPRLPALRNSPAATGSGTGLMCYESYLDLIALHLADPALPSPGSAPRFACAAMARPGRCAGCCAIWQLRATRNNPLRGRFWRAMSNGRPWHDPAASPPARQSLDALAA